MGNLGLTEMLLIGILLLIFFGPSKLPELGKSLGKTVKSFQTAAKARGPASSTAAPARVRQSCHCSSTAISCRPRRSGTASAPAIWRPASAPG